MTSSIDRVKQALGTCNIPFTIKHYADTTRTAVEAAQQIGCSVAEIVKSIVFKTKEEEPRVVLVLTSGCNRVNEKTIKSLVGKTIAKADADFVKQNTGFTIGGVAPVGHLRTPITIIDAELFNFKDVWAAAGTPHTVFSLPTSELTRLTNGTIASVQ